jgi:hypothetical protein
MEEFPGLVSGVTVNRIITKSLLRNMFRDAETIQIIRSGVYFLMAHGGDVIEEVCNASSRRKEIRYILPSIFNEDVAVRAREAGLSPAEVLAKLADWHEELARISARLHPKHSLELRTTMDRHRYHAIFTETHGIIGPPWHTLASLTTSSFLIGPEASSVISNMHRDFDVFYQTCTPYKLGDNERLRKQAPLVKIEDPVLLDFGRTLPWVLEALRYIASSFPLVDGSGATKDHLHTKFGTDKGDCNKRLKDMEDAGLVKRVGDRSGQDRLHGRIATGYGIWSAEKYKHYSFGP